MFIYLLLHLIILFCFWHILWFALIGICLKYQRNGINQKTITYMYNMYWVSEIYVYAIIISIRLIINDISDEKIGFHFIFSLTEIIKNMEYILLNNNEFLPELLNNAGFVTEEITNKGLTYQFYMRIPPVSNGEGRAIAKEVVSIKPTTHKIGITRTPTASVIVSKPTAMSTVLMGDKKNCVNPYINMRKKPDCVCESVIEKHERTIKTITEKIGEEDVILIEQSGGRSLMIKELLNGIDLHEYKAEIIKINQKGREFMKGIIESKDVIKCFKQHKMLGGKIKLGEKECYIISPLTTKERVYIMGDTTPMAAHLLHTQKIYSASGGKSVPDADKDKDAQYVVKEFILLPAEHINIMDGQEVEDFLANNKVQNSIYKFINENFKAEHGKIIDLASLAMEKQLSQDNIKEICEKECKAFGLKKEESREDLINNGRI